MHRHADPIITPQPAESVTRSRPTLRANLEELRKAEVQLLRIHLMKLSEKGLEWPMGPPFWPPEQRNEPSLTSFRRFLRLEVRAYRGFSEVSDYRIMDSRAGLAST
jgi:hypothetical protein